MNHQRSRGRMGLATVKRVDVVLGHLLIFALRPLAMLLGLVLRRDHALTVERHLVVLKMLGGGSLIVALPALLALRRKHPAAKLTLVCTPGVRAYADLTAIFDDVVVIDTRSLAAVVLTGTSAWWRCWRSDCIVDLEIHSKLSTVFSLLTCARNRVGYFMEQSRWRLGLGSHFLFLNVTSLIATSYNQLATLFGTRVDVAETVAWFRSHNPVVAPLPPHRFARVVALAPFCSELGRERELTGSEWAKIIAARPTLVPATILLLGDGARRDEADAMAEAIRAGVDDSEVVSLVGATDLPDALGILAQADHILTIDSGLHHLARLVARRITSVWGPTDPATRLLPIPGLEEEVIYRKIFCSPCVHLIDVAPCQGNNICIKQHVGAADIERYETTGWTIDRETRLV